MKMEFPGLVTQDVVKREGANEKLATIDRRMVRTVPYYRTTTQAEEATVEKRAMSRTTRKQSLP
jgi:hypothetical protein